MQPDEYPEITFTREQFYEKVWSAPAAKIAKELGCSDVLIGKICKAYCIPKPYLGYWAKLEHGQNPPKTPLPKNDDPDIQALTFYRSSGREMTIAEPGPEPKYDADIQQMLEKARRLEPITVATSLRNPHPLVAATRDQIKADRTPFNERLYSEREERRPTLSVEVGKDMTTRALCIMDALIKRVERLGGSVEIKNERWHEWKTQTIVCFGGEEVSAIRLREKQNQIRVPSDKDRGYFSSHTELRPSGLLILDRGPSCLNSILLRDTPKRRRIEDGLNDLIVDFVKQAGDLRIRRREEEEARRLQEERERIRRQQEEEVHRRREDLVERQKAEQARVDELVNHANSWRQGQIVREYLAAVCDMLLERDGAIAIDGEAAQYLRWAHQQAERLDPLRPSPPSVLDEHS